jgi:hypothetical protein
MQVLRLRLPAEVRVSDSKCQRAKVNGALLIIMPKVNPNENAVSLRGDQRAREAGSSAGSGASTIPTIPMGAGTAAKGRALAKSAATSSAPAGRTVLKPKTLSIHEQMLLDAQAAAGSGVASEATGRSASLLDSDIGAAKAAVNVANIVRRKETADDSLFQTNKGDTVFQRPSKVEELD